MTLPVLKGGGYLNRQFPLNMHFPSNWFKNISLLQNVSTGQLWDNVLNKSKKFRSWLEAETDSPPGK